MYGRVMDAILNGGFEITDIEMMQMGKMDTEEFLEVYKGVIPHHNVLLC